MPFTQSVRSTPEATEAFVKEAIIKCYRKYINDIPVTIGELYFADNFRGGIVAYDVMSEGKMVSAYITDIQLIRAHQKGHREFKPHSKNFDDPEKVVGMFKKNYIKL